MLPILASPVSLNGSTRGKGHWFFAAVPKRSRVRSIYVADPRAKHIGEKQLLAGLHQPLQSGGVDVPLVLSLACASNLHHRARGVTLKQTFTSAGGTSQWETFTLSQEAEISRLDIVAVEGPDGYPVLRILDLRIFGTRTTTGVRYVSYSWPWGKGLDKALD